MALGSNLPAYGAAVDSGVIGESCVGLGSAASAFWSISASSFRVLPASASLASFIACFCFMAGFAQPLSLLLGLGLGLGLV